MRIYELINYYDMDLQNFTIKAQEAVQRAQQLALEKENTGCG